MEVHIPYVRNEYKEPTNNDTAVALDPGFKTFQTFYSNETCGKYQQDEHRMKRICDMLDYYKWTLNTKWHASKYVKYKTDKLYRKQLHLVEEMHSRIINDITSKYNWIFLPTFETQDMLEGRGYTKGKRDVKRHAYQLCHFKFKERLKHRCHQMKNSKVLIVSEAWTTKTCSGCGWIWSDMTTKDRMFTCKSCKLEIDRDINGARNIMIRTLTG
jgi:putative transposase